MASSSVASASNPAVPKKKTPNRLLLDDHPDGPQPHLGSKYRTSAQFRQMYRAYQWLQGYDLRVAEETPTSIRLVCATHPTCSFDITARERRFMENEGELVAGKTGWSLKEPPIVQAEEESDKDYEARKQRFEERIKAEFAASTTHNHAAPYVPLDEATENARRATLQPGDRTLEKPPLVLVAQGFAGDESDDSVEIVPRAGAGFASTSGSRATPSASSAAGGSNPYDQPYPSPQSSKPPAVYQTGPASGPAAAFPSATHIGAATTAAGTGSFPMQAQASPSQDAVAFASGPTHSVGGSAPAFPPPSPSASSSRDNELSELQQFLLEIDPTFSKYFENFGDVIPLDTSVNRLLALDNGAEDSPVFKMFLEIRGLPVLHAAMASDGVRKAKMRKAKNPSSATLDPRIAIGIQRAEAEKWFQDRMKDGQAILDQEAAAAAAAAAAW